MYKKISMMQDWSVNFIRSQSQEQLKLDSWGQSMTSSPVGEEEMFKSVVVRFICHKSKFLSI